MLRMDAYSVMDGLMVRFAGFDPDRKPCDSERNGAAVSRLIPTETIENLGLDHALKECFQDVTEEYPGLLAYALR